MLELPARGGDIVGALRRRHRPHRALSLIGADALDDRVAHALAAAGHRVDDIEWNILIQHVEITPTLKTTPRPSSVRTVGSSAPPAPGVRQAADRAHRPTGADRRSTVTASYGFTYLTVLEPALEAFARVLPHLRRS